jgi:hypothetical protein
MIKLFSKTSSHESVGKRIKLGHMEDPYPIPDGATGTVTGVDDWGHVHVQWDNGRTLSVIPGEDSYEILDEGEN